MNISSDVGATVCFFKHPLSKRAIRHITEVEAKFKTGFVEKMIKMKHWFILRKFAPICMFFARK